MKRTRNHRSQAQLDKLAEELFRAYEAGFRADLPWIVAYKHALEEIWQQERASEEQWKTVEQAVAERCRSLAASGEPARAAALEDAFRSVKREAWIRELQGAIDALAATMGGREGGGARKAAAATRREAVLTEWQKHLKRGSSEREIAGKLAARGVGGITSAKQVRKIATEAGLRAAQKKKRT